MPESMARQGVRALLARRHVAHPQLRRCGSRPVDRPGDRGRAPRHGRPSTACPGDTTIEVRLPHRTGSAATETVTGAGLAEPARGTSGSRRTGFTLRPRVRHDPGHHAAHHLGRTHGERLREPLGEGGDPRQPAHPAARGRDRVPRDPRLRRHGPPAARGRPARRPRLRPARRARPGQDAADALAGRPARRVEPGRRGLRDQRRPDRLRSASAAAGSASSSATTCR